MDHQICSAALGLAEPWFIKGLDFDDRARKLIIRIDFRRGARFAHDGDGSHPAHDPRLRRYRHLNFFQHECELEARVPRVRLPDGGVAAPGAGDLHTLRGPCVRRGGPRRGAVGRH